MAASPTIARKKAERFSGNIDKRGLQKKKVEEEKMPVGGVVLVVLIFVIVGSFFMQFMQTINNQQNLDD